MFDKTKEMFEVPKEHRHKAIMSLLADIHVESNIQFEMMTEMMSGLSTAKKVEIRKHYSERRRVLHLELASYLVEEFG